MKNFFLCIIAALICSNCVENSSTESISKEDNSDSITSGKESAKQLIFEVELETSEPDEFTVFCNDIFLNNNQSMSIRITQKFTFNETKKKMKFVFPEDIIPDYNIGFLLGTKTAKEIRINKIRISFGDKQIQISDSELSKYFIFNKYVEFNKVNNNLIIRKIDGKLNPFISLKRKYLDRLIN